MGEAIPSPGALLRAILARQVLPLSTRDGWLDQSPLNLKPEPH